MRRGEGGFDLGPQGRLVGLHRQQIIGALFGDRLGDGGIGGDGVDGDDGALQTVLGAEPGEQRRDGGELVRLVRHRLLRQHQAGGGGEGGDEVERPCARAAVMAAARGLAVDRHQIGLLRPGFPHPVGEGRGEQRRVDAVHQDGEPALAWNAMLVGEVLAEKAEMRRAPGGDVFVVVAIGDATADHQKENLRQRMQDPPHVARVLHLRKVVEQRGKPRLPGQGLGSQGHGRLRSRAAASIQKNCRLSPVI